ncbi:MAG: recombinase family protein [Nitrospirales bacterium]
MIAEEERRKIGMRTREALAALKRRGVKLGNPNNERFKLARRKAVQTRMIQADAFAQSMLPIIQTYQRQGLTLRKIAEELNQRNIPTARGGRWHATRLVEMLKRMSTRA